MTSERRAGWRRWPLVVAVTIVAVSLVLPATWVENGYCCGVYPWIQAVLVPLTGWTSWPLMGIAIALLPVLIPFVAYRRWRRGRSNGVTRGALWRGGLLRALRAALFVYAAFLLLWGIGYQRVAIEERWQLDEALEYDDVRDVQLRLLSVLHRDGAAPRQPEDVERAWRSIAESERAMVRELEGWTPALPDQLKHPPAGTLMAIGIYGVVSPFTLEANVDPALPDPMRLAIGGHELAHLLGYCGEADANLASFVAGLRAEDPLARYGTALSMMRYAMSLKHAKDSLWLSRNLPQCARDDYAALRGARERHTVAAVASVTSAVNDAYLKTQGVSLGTDDYARGFTLFVKAFRRGLVPLPEPYDPASGK